VLVIAKFLHDANSIAVMHQQITANATSVDYASRLWQVFRAVIAGALDEMTMLIEDMASEVMGAIERHAQNYSVQALQLDVRTLRLEAK